MIFKECPQFRDLVTFVPNKIEPIHNWYYFKEGFSKKLVEHFIREYKIPSNSVVLDPFCGVGTTLLTCKQNGIKSVGAEICPLFAFVSKVKTQNYDLDVLEKDVKTALSWKFERPRELPNNEFVKKALSRYALEDVVFYKSKINEIDNQESRDFLTLSLIDSTTKGSWTVKDGALLRIVKEGKPPVGKLFKYKIKRMFKDLKRVNLKPVETTILLEDARNLAFDRNSIEYVITSPPYLNKIEYTKIYKLELLLFFGYPESQLRSYIGEGDVYDITSEMPVEASNYFSDLEKVFVKLYDACKHNSKLVVVIGGGCFPNKAVESDYHFAKLAEKIGFFVNDILVARNSWCTRARTIKIGKIRESIVILEK
jgi:DNA modification methylase